MVQQLAADYPDRFAPMTMHVDDDYEVSWGKSRLEEFYGIGGRFPTFIVDTRWNCQPADYRYYVQQQLADPTDVTLELSGIPQGGSTWDITARVCLEGNGSRSVRVFTAATLDQRAGLPRYTTNLLMQKVQDTDVTISADCQNITHRINFDSVSMASSSNIVIVSWVQQPVSSTPATVYQAGVMRWPFPAGSQLSTIDVAPADVTMTIGDSVSFTATGKDQSSQSYPLQNPAWSFGAGTGNGGFNPATGATTTFTATAAGTRQLLCTEDGVTGATVVTILETPRLTAIDIDPHSATVAVDGRFFFSATGRDQYGDDFELTDPAWSIAGTGDGTFEPATGSATTFTAGYPGAAAVTCAKSDVVATAAVEITGDDPRLETITVSPATAQLGVGGELELEASGTDQYGRVMDLTDAIWRVEGDGSGVFDPTGGSATTFTATAAGSAQLICVADGIEGIAAVEISAAGLPAPRRSGRRVTP